MHSFYIGVFIASTPAAATDDKLLYYLKKKKRPLAHSDLVPAYKKTKSWGTQAVRGLPWARGRRLSGGTAEVPRRERGQKS